MPGQGSSNTSMEALTTQADWPRQAAATMLQARREVEEGGAGSVQQCWLINQTVRSLPG